MPSSSKMNNSIGAETDDLLAVLGAGSPRELASNNALSLSRADHFWILMQGTVDVFAVTMRADTPISQRIHLFRAEPGQWLVGMCPLTGAAGAIELIAIGEPGTLVLEFERETLAAQLINTPALASVAQPRIDTWLTQISSAIQAGMAPSGKQISLDSDTPIDVQPDDCLCHPHQPIWLSGGAANPVLLDDAALPQPGHAAGWFPLAPPIWMKARQAAEIQCRNTAAMLSTDDFWPALDEFHALILSFIEMRYRQAETQARARNAIQAVSDQKKLKKSLFRLSTVLKKEKVDDLLEINDFDDLYTAAYLVARAGGINIAEPVSTADLNDIRDISKKNHFSIRRVRLLDNWWTKDNGPFLAYMRADNRPVALLPRSARSYKIYDPSDHSRRKVNGNIAQTLQEDAFVFSSPFPSKALSFWDLIKFISGSILGDLILMIIVGCIGAIIGLLIPITTSYIVDSIIPYSEKAQLWQLSLFLFASVLARTLFDITRAVAMVRVEGKMDAFLQAGVIERLFSLPIQFFQKFAAGDLANRSMGINFIRQILSGVILTNLMTCIFSVFNLLLLFWYDWKLALVAIGITLVAIVLTAIFGAWMVHHQRPIFKIQGMLSGLTLQLISGIVKIRVTGAENLAFGLWSDLFAQKQARAFKVGKIKAGLDTIASIIPVLSTLIIFWCFLNFRNESMSVGNFLAFFTAFNIFLISFIQMAVVSSNILYIIPLMDRAKPVLSTVPEADESKAKVTELYGLVSAQHISYRYNPGGPLILKDVSLEARPGEFIAIVGGSGSGKSTLLKLFLGFDYPESGSVFYDNRNLRNIDVRDVRQRLGVVLQNAQIMPGSVYENIIGISDLTLDDAWEAARMVGLADDIEAMPMKMNTYLATGGSSLSGGQMQRLMIARAIVHRPKILFLDEATSALDNRTQLIVSNSIEKLNVTRIVIAHRLSTIIKADRIFVLQNGEIIESGPYEKLMQNKGFFYELAKRQIS